MALNGPQAGIGIGLAGIGVLYAIGAVSITSDTGYSAVGPSFVPIIVSAALIVCGLLLFYQAASGGYRNVESAPEHPPAWTRLVWISAGLLINALIINKVGFVLAGVVLFVLACRAFGSTRWLSNVLIGFAVSLPVFWLFNKGLGLNLPALITGGWV